MRALGLAVDLPSPNRPALRAVLLEYTSLGSELMSNVAVVESFDVPTTKDDRPTQLMDLADAIHGRIQTLAPDVIVVRRADRPPRANNDEGPRVRLLATGAITAVARSAVTATFLRTGKECGTAFGSTKEAVDIAADTLVAKKHVPAAAAALSGLASFAP